eukprot:gene1469-12923_t
MHCSAGDPKAPSNTRRNQRRGRGSGGGLDGGDEASASFAKERMRKRMGVNGVVVFLTALLPSLVAGQSMTCGRSKPLGSGYPYGSGYHSFVTPSTETMAKFSALAYNTATFREGVKSSDCSKVISVFNLFVELLFGTTGGTVPVLSCQKVYYSNSLENLEFADADQCQPTSTATRGMDNELFKRMLAIEASDKSTSDDTYTKDQVDAALANKVDSNATYTKDQVDAALANKADSDDTYTKDQVDAALANKADSATSTTTTITTTAPIDTTTTTTKTTTKTTTNTATTNTTTTAATTTPIPTDPKTKISGQATTTGPDDAKYGSKFNNNNNNADDADAGNGCAGVVDSDDCKSLSSGDCGSIKFGTVNVTAVCKVLCNICDNTNNGGLDGTQSMISASAAIAGGVVVALVLLAVGLFIGRSRSNDGDNSMCGKCTGASTPIAATISSFTANIQHDGNERCSNCNSRVKFCVCNVRRSSVDMAQPRTITTAPQSQGSSSRLLTIRTASTDGNRHPESLYDDDDGNGGVVHDDNGMPGGIAVTSFGGGAAGGGKKCAWNNPAFTADDDAAFYLEPTPLQPGAHDAARLVENSFYGGDSSTYGGVQDSSSGTYGGDSSTYDNATSEDGPAYAIPVDDGGDDGEGYAVPTSDHVSSGGGNAASYAIPMAAGLPLDLEGYVVDDTVPSSGRGARVYATAATYTSNV